MLSFLINFSLFLEPLRVRIKITLALQTELTDEHSAVEGNRLPNIAPK